MTVNEFITLIGAMDISQFMIGLVVGTLLFNMVLIVLFYIGGWIYGQLLAWLMDREFKKIVKEENLSLN